MEVTVKPKSLRRSAGTLKGIAGNINRAARIIQQTSCNLDTRMAAYETVAAKLRNYSDGIEEIGKKTKKLGNAGVKIAYLYEDADSESASNENLATKVLWGMGMGALGPLGEAIDSVKSINEGNYGKAGGKVIKLVGEVVKATEDGDVDWRNLFNLDVIDNPLGKAKEKLTSKTAWAAAIVENGWDNYKEHGGFTARFFGETGVESAIDIGKAALLSVGVGAAFVAVGISAPAWVVGATAAGVGIAVDAGLDWVVKKVSGNPDAKWKEAASDFICDTGEAAFKGARKILNSAVKGFKKTHSTVRWGRFNLGGMGGR